MKSVIQAFTISSASRRSRLSAARSGLTLMELILVLAVLVAIAAIVLPSLQGPMDDHRLRKAGDLVRAELSKVRLKAMKTGRIHLFSYQVGDGMYSVQPWVGDADLLEASADDVPQAAPRQLQPRDQLNQLGVSGVTLPPGVVFFGGTSETDARGAEAASSQSAGGSGMGGSQAIVFYPDGSSSEAKVILTNQRFFVQIKLRGLTGLTQGSDLLAAEELAQ